ncbi:DUF3885 domain-containing protein [Rossellomorea aquimaris]|nr:DUF3885 domain-containing protein [Rossellomorea aquimaris]WRP07211.1 DUF3885 domain-containing protein [Rossellomorea aquimaris]
MKYPFLTSIIKQEEFEANKGTNDSSIRPRIQGVRCITDVQTMKYDRFLENRPTKVYQKYIRRKDTRYKLFYELFHIEEEDENLVKHRFILPCHKHDIRYQQLLMAISYEDFPHPTQLLKGSQHAGIDIYFVNVTRKMIFHLYDDRGCDVIASDKEDLRSLYREFNDWILDYDRVQIDNMMNTQLKMRLV